MPSGGLRGPVAVVQTCTMQRDTVTREPALPHLRTVAHGTQEGRVAAGALRQLAEDPLGQRRVESTQLERKRLTCRSRSSTASS